MEKKEKEDFRKTLEKTYREIGEFLPDLRDGSVLWHVIKDPISKKLVEDQIKEAEEAAGYVLVAGSLEFLQNHASDTEHYFGYRRRPTTKTGIHEISVSEEIERWLKISRWEVDRICVRNADSGKVAFWFRYMLVVDIGMDGNATNGTSQGYSHPLKSRAHYYWSRPVTIPLVILACWMKRELEDESEGIICEGPVTKSIIYDSGSYPTALWHLFESSGEMVFHRLLDEGLLSRENFLLITRRVRAMRSCTGEFATELQENRIPHPSDISTNMSSESRGLFAALELSRKYRKRLVELSKVKRPYSLSKLGEILGLSKTGAHSFLQKMEDGGWLNPIPKGSDGILRTLSEKGRLVVTACLKDPRLIDG